MWFKHILLEMTARFMPHDHPRAKSFTNNLFTEYKCEFYPKEPLPLELRLGILEKMHHFFIARQYQVISLDCFSQQLFGLLMIYTKSDSEHQDTWSRDFCYLTEHPVIHDSMEFSAIEKYCFDKSMRTLEKLGIPESSLSKEQLTGIDNRIQTRSLRWIETKVLKSIDHNITPNLPGLLQVFYFANDIYYLKEFMKECSAEQVIHPPLTELATHITDMLQAKSVYVGFGKTPVSNALWKRYCDHKQTINEQRFMNAILSLQYELVRLRDESCFNPVKYVPLLQALTLLEGRMIQATLSFFARDIDHKVFFQHVRQAAYQAKEIITDEAWLSYIDNLMLGAAKLNSACDSHHKAQYFRSTLLFKAKSAEEAKYKHSVETTDAVTFITQSK